MMQKYFQNLIWNLAAGWQIHIDEKYRYKIAFKVLLTHYDWNVTPFVLKNAHLEFQHVVNDVRNDYSEFSMVYIDDVLIYLKILDQNFKHLKTFVNVIKRYGLAISAPKF